MPSQDEDEEAGESEGSEIDMESDEIGKGTIPASEESGRPAKNDLSSPVQRDKQQSQLRALVNMVRQRTKSSEEADLAQVYKRQKTDNQGLLPDVSSGPDSLK